MANPSGNNQENGNNNNTNTNTNNNYNGNNNNNSSNGKLSSENAAPPAPRALKHSPEPGLSSKWSPEEQIILDEGLIKYASEIPMARYALIAASLHDKTVRDVALRSRWMTKKESGKRRKEDMLRKSKDKKERTTDPSVKSSAHLAIRPSVPPYAPPTIPVDNDDGISYQAIGGPTGHLLEQNAQVFEQISANFATLQIHDVHKNINLFCQTRDNILTIMNELNDTPGIMKQMPPLPVKVNEELANSILPRPTRPMQS